MAPDTELFRKAQRHLARRDPVLKRLVAQVGPCTLAVNSDSFMQLVRAIIAQQISTKAAAAITQRVHDLVAPAVICSQSILLHSEESLRSAGLSVAKARYLLDLSAKVHAGEVALDAIGLCEDEEIIEQLIQVKGIGRWTAQMFLIFSLGRMDILPVDDLGLRAGVKDAYALPELPDRETVTEIAEPWKPYRSIATWYFWRSRGPVPQSR